MTVAPLYFNLGHSFRTSWLTGCLVFLGTWKFNTASTAAPQRCLHTALTTSLDHRIFFREVIPVSLAIREYSFLSPRTVPIGYMSYTCHIWALLLTDCLDLSILYTLHEKPEHPGEVEHIYRSGINPFISITNVLQLQFLLHVQSICGWNSH